MKRFIFIFCVLNFYYELVYTQFYNYGSVYIETSGAVYVTTDFANESGGSINNWGTILLGGNWANNNPNNQVFINSSPGTVKLIGGNQFIGGTNQTKFFNLSLEGTGIKTLQINSEVEGTLFLNDRELATDQNIMFVSNSSISAITFTSGFVSSLGNGYLRRAMNSTLPYIFPVGSSLGTPRYRPVELTSSTSANQIMGVRFANTDPTNESFDRTITDGQVGNINSLFFHKIERVSGSAPMTVSIFFDSSQDGTFNEIAHWDDQPSARWEATTTATLNNGTPLSTLTINSWNDFTHTPFALYGCTPSTQPTNIVATDTIICAGQQVTLTVQGGSLGSGAQWTWYTDNCGGTPIGTGNSIQVSPTSTTTYYVNAVGSCGTTECTYLKIEISQPPVISINSNSPLCVGSTLNLSASGGIQYQWSGPNNFTSNQANPSIANVTLQHAGIYYVTVTNAEGCTSTAQITVQVSNLPQGTISPSQSVCEGQTISLQASGGTTYNWGGPNNFNQTGATVQITNATTANAGTYYVTITNNDGCSIVLNTTVNIQASPQVSATYSGAACEGNSITLQANPSGMSSYQWSGPNNFTSNIQNPVINNVSSASSGTYTVTITHSCGTSTATVNVTIYERPSILGMNTNNESCKEMKDGHIQPSISGGTSPFTFTWNTGSTQPQLEGLSEGTYTVTISDANGCTTTGTANILRGEHECFFIPTIFSPNGDGNNDVLYVRGHGIKELLFRIYDRWGNLIFESTSPQTGWDGTFKGKPMNAGAYAYIVKIKFYNGTEKEIKDNITLIR
ncbi:MAG: gliding motility-associated C-terminal domain-containing protein [Bacteroidales bacterium]|nr:gliding motility-associated C-terminal domain-containing protein [Bacteroidales bacterium]